jgi:plasmid maintenance system antidote protein VapI
MDNPLLDYLLKQFDLRRDVDLARALQVNQPLLSKIRHGTISITPSFILKVHETFDIPVKEIKKLANVN